MELRERQAISQALYARTKCATCYRYPGDYPKVPLAVEGMNGNWHHLHSDGSFLGPCFDALVAKGLAALAGIK